MASTRDFKSPGVFAEDATTVIPPTPIQGVAYRDAVTGTSDVPNGWRYGATVKSQDWNQIMFQATSIISEIDKRGVLGWSDQVLYDEPAITFSSDGTLYLWVQASGPGAGGAKDPISSPTYWTSLSSLYGGQAGDIKYVAANSAPSGWLKSNGAAVSRTTYSALFARIGTTFGAGDGSTTFNLPDLRAEFIRGWDDSRGVDAGRAFGTYQLDDFKSHRHVIVGGSSSTGAPTAVDVYAANQGVGVNSEATGGTETRGRNIALLGCIKF